MNPTDFAIAPNSMSFNWYNPTAATGLNTALQSQFMAYDFMGNAIGSGQNFLASLFGRQNKSLNKQITKETNIAGQIGKQNASALSTAASNINSGGLGGFFGF